MTEEVPPLLDAAIGKGAFTGLPEADVYEFEARYTEEAGWYVVDPDGGLAHYLNESGETVAARFGDNEQAACWLTRSLNEKFDLG